MPQGLSAVPIQAVQSICNTPVSAIAGIKILHAPGGGKLLWVEVEYPEVIESGVGAVFAFVFKWLHDYLRVSFSNNPSSFSAVSVWLRQG